MTAVKTSQFAYFILADAVPPHTFPKTIFQSRGSRACTGEVYGLNRSRCSTLYSPTISSDGTRCDKPGKSKLEEVGSLKPVLAKSRSVVR